MDVCLYVFIPLFIWGWQYDIIYIQIWQKKDSRSWNELFLLVSFHQEVEKVMYFHLHFSYFLSSTSPLFFPFPSTSASFFTNTSPGLFTNPKWLGNYVTKHRPFVDDLQVEMSLFGPVLLWRVSHPTLAERELENKANALCCREECIYLSDAWVPGMLLQHFPWNHKSLKVTVFWSWHARINLAMVLPWLQIPKK